MAGQAPHRRRILAWTGAVLAIVLLAPVAGADRGATSLRAENATIDASRHSAALALFSLDTELDSARVQLAALQQQAAALRAERASARTALRLARTDVRKAQRNLAERLRLLYEQGEVSPLEVVLGARSLEEALAGLDSLDRVATQDRHVLAEVRRARRILTRLDRTLAGRQARIERLEVSAAATASSLARARASKAAYVRSLTDRRQLNDARIAALEAGAQAAATRAATLQAGPSDTRAPDLGAPGDTGQRETGSAVPAGVAGSLTVSSTGYAIHGRTATGVPTGWGVAAVDPAVIPLGTRLTVPGYGEAVAADVGSGVRGATIDLWFPTVAQAQAWGRRTVTITLH